MNIEIIKKPTENDWLLIKDSALTTMGLSVKNKPDEQWKSMILRSEHSPIRDLIYQWKWVGLRSWVSVHFVRHKIGIEHFVKTQRSDRQKDSTYYDRDRLPQGALVNHKCSANAQAIINISKKRLCHQASTETRQAWQLLLDNLDEPELIQLCVPTCIYRNGICPEPKSCGYTKTTDFKIKLQQYIALFKED
jgi:hypothetical protein